MQSPLGNFGEAWRAVDRPDLVAPPVLEALALWSAGEEVLVVDTDPELADTANFCAAYDVAPEASANCVVVAGKRGGAVTMAACLVLASTRADVNGLVRKQLDVRKASFAPVDSAVAQTGMEYGGITPIGIPADWRLLVDASVAEIDNAIVGSGIRGSKLFLPGEVLTRLPGAEIVASVAR
jgi:prolyl-tRNA editing enzyme YbaK/EbsC (Cys-tRNA(Pro) deacylase)